MNNPRITAKERGLIKGAIRRAFARSELHQRISSRTRIEHSDPNRPRCSKWSFCEECGLIIPTWTTSVDHIQSVIPLNSSMEEMSMDELINNIWCEESNLQVLCDPCHTQKTKEENKIRKQFKDAKKPPKEKKVKNKKR